MIIKVGSIVSHASALGWGTGKVLELTPSLATIQFSDGKNRKIAVSHFTTLEPAPLSTFTPPVETTPEKKPARVPRVTKKKK